SMAASHGLAAAWRLWRRGEKARYLAAFLALEGVARINAQMARALGKTASDGVWKPIQSSKRVLANGHALRSHHDSVCTLRLHLSIDLLTRGRRDRQLAIQDL